MSKNAKQRIARAVFESLEGRQCMSASVTLTAGVLSLQADPNTASIMQVQLESNTNYLSAYATNVLKEFPTSQVKKIVIVGSNKNDAIYIDPRITIPASITGGAGNDSIKAGAGYDTINGGDGNDIIYGHGIIYTNAGNDTVWGSNLGDQIYGGTGNDLLVGGAGNNTIVGGASGNDTIIGGYGTDHLYAGGGNAKMCALSPEATLVGGKGHDTLYGAGGGNVLYSGGSANTLIPGKGDVISKGTAPATPANPVATVSSTPPTVSSTPPKSSSSTPPPVQTPPVQTPPVQTPPVQTPPPSGGITTGSSTVTALITQLETNITAGEGVEVNALTSQLNGASPLIVKYQWNFGDPNSQFNTLPGWNAGHVYDTPGAYTITLTLTDAAGGVSTATSLVTVASDNRPIIYVSNTGSDSNDGSTPNTAVKTAAQAFSMLGSNTKILFARGQTFSVTQDLFLNGHDIAIGAYGTGASPILLRGNGGDGQTIFVTPSSSNVTIQGLTFDSIWPAVNGIAPKINADGIWAEGSNLVIRGNTFLNVTDAINGSMHPTGVIVLDNSAPLTTGVRGYVCWVDGNNWSILGNFAANSTREHIVRGNDPAIVGVLFDANNFTNLVSPLDPDETPKTTINFRGSTYVYVANNILSQGTTAFDSPGINPGAMNTYVVIEDNTFNQAQVQLWGNVNNAMIRDNVFNVTGIPDVQLQVTTDVDPTVKLGAVTVTDNTGINNGTTGSFLALYGDATAGSIALTHNLYSAPNLLSGVSGNGGVYVVAANLNGFSTIADNIWPAPSGANFANPGAVNAVTGSIFPYGYMTASQWNAIAVVDNDVFEEITLAQNTFKATAQGVTAGVQATAA